MSGLDLKAIHEAVADAIRSGIAKSDEFTVKAFPSTSSRPVIEVWPDAEYINYFDTSGPAGVSDVKLVVRLYLSNANAESEWLVMARLLSAGTGHNSSVVDALMQDRTLGGVVADTFVGDAEWNPQDATIDIPVAIQINKIGGPV